MAQIPDHWDVSAHDLGGLARRDAHRGGPPPRLHPDSQQMVVQKTTCEFVRLVSATRGERAWLELRQQPTHIEAAYHLEWPNIGTSDGVRLLTLEQAKMAFLITIKERADIQPVHVISKFARWGDRLRIPGSGEPGRDGDPNIDIVLTPAIVEAIRALLDQPT